MAAKRHRLAMYVNTDSYGVHGTQPLIATQNRGYRAWVQSALNEITGTRLKVDGIIGPKTRAVIRTFQSERGLKADGIAGPKTRAALRAAGAPPLPWEHPKDGTLGALVPTPGCVGLSGIKSRSWGWEVWLNSCMAEGMAQSGAATAGVAAICSALTAGACQIVAAALVSAQYTISAVNTWGGKRGVKIFIAPTGWPVIPIFGVPVTPFAIYPQ